MNMLPTAVLTMTSREIADLTGKRHDNVMRDIHAMLVELYGEGGILKFEDTHRNQQNQQTYKIFQLPKREALILVSGYSVEMRARIIDRWQELEAAATPPAPALPNFADPVAAARAWADAKEAEQKAVAALELAAPKVEFVDRYVQAQGAMTFRQVAKLLKANEAELRQFLQDKKIMYRLGAGWAAYKSHEEAGRFVTNTGVANSNAHAFTSTRFTPKGVQWIAGLWGAFKATNQLRLLA